VKTEELDKIIAEAPDLIREQGMSLRDWFAGQMLAGEFVQSEYAGHYSNECPQQTLLDRAQLLYRMADAMVAARKEKV